MQTYNSLRPGIPVVKRSLDDLFINIFKKTNARVAMCQSLELTVCLCDSLQSKTSISIIVTISQQIKL